MTQVPVIVTGGARPVMAYAEVPPKRIQRKRTRGWRMPQGAVYVGRPSRWGNRWRVDEPLGRALNWTPALVVEMYDIEALWHIEDDPDYFAPLRGHDLACWCPLDQPCHADVLLELANRPEFPA